VIVGWIVFALSMIGLAFYVFVIVLAIGASSTYEPSPYSTY
jgi:hypothetical protein